MCKGDGRLQMLVRPFDLDCCSRYADRGGADRALEHGRSDALRYCGWNNLRIERARKVRNKLAGNFSGHLAEIVYES